MILGQGPCTVLFLIYKTLHKWTLNKCVLREQRKYISVYLKLKKAKQGFVLAVVVEKILTVG